MLTGTKIKRVLGELPLAAELDWALRSRGNSVDGFNLDELKAALPGWCAQIKDAPAHETASRKVLVYATLHYWISHATLISLALTGLGHDVTLAYSPYATWKKPVSKFDLRRREAYARSVFKPAEQLMSFASFAVHPGGGLPADLKTDIEHVSLMDTQYTLQVEDVDTSSELFNLRLERNLAAASAVFAWIKENKPDVIVVPNGLILEFGAIFRTARHLGVPVVSYEFGEQRDRIWLAHNTPVMLQETKELWNDKKDKQFSEDQRAQVKELFSTRQSAGLFKNFYRRWQNLPAEGGDAVRNKLGLDGRPVVVLAANVIGDSLTLGRATFTGDMNTWLRRTLVFFAARDDVQFVLRVHPGEKNLDGPSVADLVHAELPTLPTHMRVVAAEDSINTYDLIDIADLGLVYTTTVGLEMAMSGLPAIVVGQTHYRDKGFTIDPNSWDEYFETLDGLLAKLEVVRLNPAQVDTAWHYAYRFFFDYPQPFPWHLLHFWDDLKNLSLGDALTDEGMRDFGKTFDFVLGEPFEWETAR